MLFHSNDGCSGFSPDFQFHLPEISLPRTAFFYLIFDIVPFVHIFCQEETEKKNVDFSFSSCYNLNKRCGKERGMKGLDLTHTIKERMPVYPGTQPPVLERVFDYEKDGFRETKISLFSHTGTHVDPPAHLFPGRATLDQFPPEQFIGTALVIDCRGLPPGGKITLDQLHPYGEMPAKADFLLFCLGWDRYWGKEEYFHDYPCMDEEVLDFVIQGKYKGVGFDVMSPDPVWESDLPRHKRLLGKGDMIIIENLNNLSLCGKELFCFSCFPLKVENADGSPVRAVAWWA